LPDITLRGERFGGDGLESFNAFGSVQETSRGFA
jgi:hypothetical protein